MPYSIVSLVRRGRISHIPASIHMCQKKKVVGRDDLEAHSEPIPAAGEVASCSLRGHTIRAIVFRARCYLCTSTDTPFLSPFMLHAEHLKTTY